MYGVLCGDVSWTWQSKYRGGPPLLKFHNTRVFGQNLSIARLFYSRALIILRDFRDKKIYSASELRVWSIGGNDADRGNEEE